MFELPASADIHIIEGEYSAPLVLLSFVIAFCASYTALFINRRIQGNGFFHKNIWLVLASLAMGLGVWSMHFIGMSAFELPINMEYHIGITVLSMVPAIIASYLAFYFANSKNKKLFSYIVAGIFMGLGISLMHYLGMAAMKIDAYYVYKPIIFTVSILIAIAASFAALYIFSVVKNFMDRIFVKVVAALLLAIAITSMHYTGMQAIQFYVIGESALHLVDGTEPHSMNIMFLIIFVTVGISSLFILAFLTSRLDKYVEYRLQNFDGLTQLPNQKQFADDQKSDKDTHLVAIIHIHNLEKYNSSYGYYFVDEMIKTIYELIDRLLPESTKMYRTEANRFTIVSSTMEQSQHLHVLLERVCAVLMHPLVIDERTITVDMVCAVSKSTVKQPIQELFSNAIAVLQAPITEFKHEVIEFNPDIHTFNFENQLSLDIYTAMKNDDLFLVYQPKVDPNHDSLVGLEALIRWNHPVFGMVSPGIFIPVLEETKKISDVTDWIIEKVCEQIDQWDKLNIPFQQVSINIPGLYITSPRLSDTLKLILLKYHVKPDQLELEITETSVIHDIQSAILAVSKFRKKGFSVALDDFGTGLSSLSYLKEIPISTIKIDKSFVDGVPESIKDAAILKSIITLCYSLDLNVVIEGVETEPQLEFIQKMDKKPIVQGYYYSKPLTAEEFREWMNGQLVEKK
ncbi:oxygen sensor protein DosP [Solibacillus sp. R5-41]|uniref:EAL domain-containing protein n=1 Tax=Solibacillus sp. R5-41 TaxID=2048654 RepID=UPI000C12974D|nr:EAL domain-containing protein [Solibacillus sp. R5-41]ATP41238.1 oxygen sensor protein DosP [Solibacillus sp. R5-41]